MWILLKMYPNIYKHLWNLLVKFQLNPTVGFKVMLNSVKLNRRNFYAKSESDPAWFVSQGLVSFGVFAYGLYDHVITRFASFGIRAWII
jgi:hypothetical protein